MGGPYRDRGGYAAGALEDKRTPPSRQEGGDPVDHVRGYVLGEEQGPELSRVDVVEASLYVEEEGGYFLEGSLKGVNLVGECGYCGRGVEAGEGAALVRVKQTCLPC